MVSHLTSSEPDPITASLRSILLGLRSLLGMCGLDGPFTVLLFNRTGRIFGQIERMLTRFRAGKLRQMPHRPTAPRRQGQPRQNPAFVFPRKFAWLAVAGKHNMVCYGLQLRHLLTTEPDLVAMLEASPQARRILRPLLRALAVELPWTVTPPRPPRPRKPRKPRPKPEPFRTNLPRGVITWARREKALENARTRRRERAA